ncbi:GLUT4 regulating protein TUG-domain-containing protein [Massariosphaeria phaeospora]|uniref:GLUT4 regulating protein TUG-domain-containing protein n=1 Tax=Massariosphaeria phaeospora TaxID=100035 RepID=A0A7C8MBI0_9PLEO|nr:GLUT4 regulating protein TUG-domain-containing protein [Massariosphaeria phaeospora]
MSHVIVVNASAKAVRIPTTPVKYLTEVRDEACKKFSISNKDNFTLKYNNKLVSLSQQFRLANLPQGARLELVQSSRSPTVISVALQLPSTEKSIRLTHKFASNTALWEILRQFESGEGANYNFTQRGVPEPSGDGASGAGRLNYETPVVTVMPGHQELSSLVDLQKTLGQLGFDNGSALLRLTYRNSGTPLEKAMAQISQYFKTSDQPTQSGAHADSAAGPTSIQDPDKATPEATSTALGETVKAAEPEPDAMEVDSTPTHEPVSDAMTSVNDKTAQNENIPPSAATLPGSVPAEDQPARKPGSRNVQIFSAPASATPQAARQAFNEGDYTPTIEHAKSHQASLLGKSRNTRLLSDKELAEQEATRQAKINAVAEKGGSLRIRMPDGTLIQMDISKADTATGLYDFVTSFLDRKTEPYQLKYVGSTGRLVLIPRDNKRLIQDLRFASMEMITFLWDEGASTEARQSQQTLAQEWHAKAQALKVVDPVPNAQPEPVNPESSKAEGKRRADLNPADKESKLKNILGKGLFKR